MNDSSSTTSRAQLRRIDTSNLQRRDSASSVEKSPVTSTGGSSNNTGGGTGGGGRSPTTPLLNSTALTTGALASPVEGKKVLKARRTSLNSIPSQYLLANGIEGIPMSTNGDLNGVGFLGINGSNGNVGGMGNGVLGSSRGTSPLRNLVPSNHSPSNSHSNDPSFADSPTSYGHPAFHNSSDFPYSTPYPSTTIDPPTPTAPLFSSSSPPPSVPSSSIFKSSSSSKTQRPKPRALTFGNTKKRAWWYDLGLGGIEIGIPKRLEVMGVRVLVVLVVMGMVGWAFRGGGEKGAQKTVTSIAAPAHIDPPLFRTYPYLPLTRPSPPRSPLRPPITPPSLSYSSLTALASYQSLDLSLVSISILIHINQLVSTKRLLEAIRVMVDEGGVRVERVGIVLGGAAGRIDVPTRYGDVEILRYSYDSTMDSTSSLLSFTSSHLLASSSSDFVFYHHLTSTSPPLSPTLLSHLIRSSNVPSLSGALLSLSGLTFPSETEETSLRGGGAMRCDKPRLGDDGEELISQVHVPSSPFLLESGLIRVVEDWWRKEKTSDVGPGLGWETVVALGLLSAKSIPSFRIPLSQEGIGGPSSSCLGLLETVPKSLRLDFVGRSFHAPSRPTSPEIEMDRLEDLEGSVTMILNDAEELESSLNLICGFVQTSRVAIKVWMVEGEDEDWKGWKEWEEVGCKIELEGVRRGLLDENMRSGVSQIVTDRLRLEYPSSLSTADPFGSSSHFRSSHLDVLIYLTGGEKELEIESGIRKWGRGWWGRGSRMNGGREVIDSVGKTTVIGLPVEEVPYVEWLSRLPMEALAQWHKPQIDISVIANFRPFSLNRLLVSLQNAQYLNDEVKLSISLEQTADTLTHALVDDLDWPFGSISIRHRVVLGGLIPAIVESWYPTNNDSYGVFLEDDTEVSPYFYSWLKFSILSYRYSSSSKDLAKRMFGVSLYQPRNIELRPIRREPFDAHEYFKSLSIPETTPYLSQIPCSWGAAYFPEQWREFHEFLALRFSETAIDITEIIVPDIKSNRWPHSWKRWFNELVFMRGYTMLYPNYPGFVSFSTNHLETGTHIKEAVDEKRKNQFQVPLMGVDSGEIGGIEVGMSILDHIPTKNQRLPNFNQLPVLDLWGYLTTQEELVQRGEEAIENVGSCPSVVKKFTKGARNDKGVDDITYNARELLCQRRHPRVELPTE